VSALRIRCFELNRGDRPGYGDSIEGDPFGKGCFCRGAVLSVGSSALRTTLAGHLRTLERFFHCIWNTRSGSANRQSTVTSKGDLDNGDQKVAFFQG